MVPILGLFVSLLPGGFRQRWFADWQSRLRGSAIVSSLLQVLLSIGFLVLGYQRYCQAQLQQISSRVVLGAAEKGGETAIQSFGMAFLIGYVFTPIAILLIYFAIEGMFRFGAAVTTGEVVGTLPLVAIEKLIQVTGDFAGEQRQGTRIPDFVFIPEDNRYDLGIASCRAKTDWNRSLTISYQDGLYELADYVKGESPRRHVYLLKRAPVHKIVRGLHYYDPEEVMR